MAQNLDLSSYGNGLDADGVKLFCGPMAKRVADRAIQVGEKDRQGEGQTRGGGSNFDRGTLYIIAMHLQLPHIYCHTDTSYLFRGSRIRIKDCRTCRHHHHHRFCHLGRNTYHHLGRSHAGAGWQRLCGRVSSGASVEGR